MSGKLPIMSPSSHNSSPASTSSYSLQGSPSKSGKSSIGSLSPSALSSPLTSPTTTVNLMNGFIGRELDAMSPNAKTINFDDNNSGFSSSQSPMTPSEWLDAMHQEQQAAAASARSSPSKSKSIEKVSESLVGEAAKGKGKKGYLGLNLDPKYLEAELAAQLASPKSTLSSPTMLTPSPLKSDSMSSGKKKSSNKKEKKSSNKKEAAAAAAAAASSLMIIDIQDCPEFLESKPPVFQIKSDDAFIC